MELIFNVNVSCYHFINGKGSLCTILCYKCQKVSYNKRLSSARSFRTLNIVSRE